MRREALPSSLKANRRTSTKEVVASNHVTKIKANMLTVTKDLPISHLRWRPFIPWLHFLRIVFSKGTQYFRQRLFWSAFILKKLYNFKALIKRLGVRQ